MKRRRDAAGMGALGDVEPRSSLRDSFGFGGFRVPTDESVGYCQMSLRDRLGRGRQRVLARRAGRTRLG